MSYPYPPPPYQPPVQHVVHHYQTPPKSAGAAVALELVPGFMIQTFGIGHLYVGNIGLGLLFMFGYWFLLFINFLLCFVFVGFVTLPLCWIAMMILSPLLAASSASNQRHYF